MCKLEIAFVSGEEVTDDEGILKAFFITINSETERFFESILRIFL